jgi:hypothetical protein
MGNVDFFAIYTYIIRIISLNVMNPVRTGGCRATVISGIKPL